MADDGAVECTQVIKALEVSGVSITVASAPDGRTVLTVVTNGVPEVYFLQASVGRKMLHRLSYRYGVRIEWFYHPEMICGGSASKQ